MEMVTVVPAQGGQFDQWLPNNLASYHNQSPYSGPKTFHALTPLCHHTPLYISFYYLPFFLTPVPP